MSQSNLQPIVEEYEPQTAHSKRSSTALDHSKRDSLTFSSDQKRKEEVPYEDSPDQSVEQI